MLWKFLFTTPLEDESSGDVNMSEWMNSHPYLFFTMFLFMLTTLNEMVSEVSRIFSLKKLEKYDKEKHS